MLQTAGLNVNQHLNNVKLPVDEHHILSIAQYSADTFCEVALFDERTGKPVHLPRLYKDSEAVKNDKGDVEITHTTALNLVNALINNNEAEYYIYNVIKDKLEWKELAYPNLWKNNLGGIQ